MILNFETYAVNSLGFHWSQDLATLEDNLLLQLIKTPHHCPQLYTQKFNFKT